MATKTRWKDIASAPLDGSRIDLLVADVSLSPHRLYRVTDVHWGQGHVRSKWAWRDSSGWVAVKGFIPKYWMDIERLPPVN